MTKRMLSLLLALALSASMVACGSNQTTDDSANQENTNNTAVEDALADDTDIETEVQDEADMPSTDPAEEDTTEATESTKEDTAAESEKTPAAETPVKEEQPSENKPAESNPVEEAPVEDTPVENTPVEDTPAEEETPEESASSVDLQAYHDNFLATLGDQSPSMMAIPQEMLENYYPGLTGYELKQSVITMPLITQVAYEFALVEVQNASDVDAVKAILQQRIDAKLADQHMYPSHTEAWSNAGIIVKGNVLALIVAGEQQADAVAAFEALFA